MLTPEEGVLSVTARQQQHPHQQGYLPQHPSGEWDKVDESERSAEGSTVGQT